MALKPPFPSARDRLLGIRDTGETYDPMVLEVRAEIEDEIEEAHSNGRRKHKGADPRRTDESRGGVKVMTIAEALSDAKLKPSKENRENVDAKHSKTVPRKRSNRTARSTTQQDDEAAPAVSPA